MPPATPARKSRAGGAPRLSLEQRLLAHMPGQPIDAQAHAIAGGADDLYAAAGGPAIGQEPDGRNPSLQFTLRHRRAYSQTRPPPLVAVPARPPSRVFAKPAPAGAALRPAARRHGRTNPRQTALHAPGSARSSGPGAAR